jgi:hypothetical protein
LTTLCEMKSLDLCLKQKEKSCGKRGGNPFNP